MSLPAETHAQHFRNASGGAIDRSRPLAFTFNGEAYGGFSGDTLASALLANGVRLVARSFKYHRPRGIVTAGPEEPAALVAIGAGARALPNLPATMVELYEGLEARSINCWPNVGFDLGSIGNALSSWMPAGFYYKTFMWPGRAWMTYERFIRRAAGIGVTPGAADPDRYEKRYAHCDVLVIGGGPAGLAAVLAAGEAGARVLLVDERAAMGGQLLFRQEMIDGESSEQWLSSRLAELGGMPEVRMVARATATGYYDHNLVTVIERVTDHLAHPQPYLPRQRMWKVRAKQIVLASGAIERACAFANNDLPGVMLASAAQRYAVQYAVRPGTRAAVFMNNDSGYAAALALADCGIEIAAVFDPRLTPTAAAAAARSRGMAVMSGHAVMAAHGRRCVEAVSAALLDTRSLLPAGPTRRFACDLICVAGGWDPALHLFSQAGGRVEFDIEQQCFVPAATAQAVRAAGAANGALMVDDCIAQGRAAGRAAARGAGFEAAAGSISGRRPLAVMPLWETPCDERGAKKFVDLQSDVTTADLVLAAREGYAAVEHAKRYTTTGMGVDQGKTGNVIAYGTLGKATGRTIPEVGNTTFRPPYTPVTFGAFAGRDIGERFEPWRRTPLTDWHVRAGAVFEPVGLWRRPLYYPRPGEDMHAAVVREARAVRERVGLLDASTLGKIEICGPDAVHFLNRVYTNAWDSLGVGQCRYGLMLHEDGMVFDDGVTARLGDQHYLMTTTSGGAERVFVWLEDWLQCEWRDLKVFLTPVTAQWATVCVTGPRAREVVGKLATDIDFSSPAFPHMALRQGRIMSVPARVARVSFTGELSFEINVPWRHGEALWQALITAGEEFGITPLGTEALHVLRAEKGYVVVGHDTDGTVTPVDLGMDWIVSQAKGDFLGKRGLARSDNMREGRKQFVGLLTDDPGVVVPEGSQIVAESDAARIAHLPVPMLGHVTSSYHGPALGRSVALALLADGRRRIGSRVAIITRGRAVMARVAEPRFYDPGGARLQDTPRPPGEECAQLRGTPRPPGEGLGVREVSPDLRSLACLDPPTLRVSGDAARVLLRECEPPGALNLRLHPLPPSRGNINPDPLPPLRGRVRVGGGTALDKVQQSLGITLPLAPAWVEADGVTIAWQAFDEWLLLTPDGSQITLLECLREALAGHHAALTDVSDLYAAFEINGPSSRDLLAKGCALDLHPRVFKTGSCALTALARVRVTLRQLDDAPHFQVLVERSYARYLRDWLTDAAVEILGA